MTDERIAKRHAEGKLTARERIDRLVDDGSFVEFDQQIEDGVITGYALSLIHISEPTRPY